MNTQEFIISGILETYVLGIATETERREVETRAVASTEIREELERLSDNLETYVLSQAVTPPERLRGRILASLEALSEPSKISKVQWLRPFAAAASVALLMSIGGNYLLFNNLKSTEGRVSELEAQNTLIAKNLDVKTASFTEEIALLSDPSVKKITLSGQPVAPNATASVYVKGNNAYLASLKLPTPPAGKQYQLWAIVDGKPVSAGVIGLDETFRKINDFEGSTAAFAISLEPLGGSPKPTPTGDVYVMGAI